VALRFLLRFSFRMAGLINDVAHTQNCFPPDYDLNNDPL
jgi:hypothetical protein